MTTRAPTKQEMLQMWAELARDAGEACLRRARGEVTPAAVKAVTNLVFDALQLLNKAEKRLRTGTRRGPARPGTPCPRCHMIRRCGWYEGRCMPGGKLYCRCEGRTPPCPGCVACSDLKPPEVPE